MRDILFKCSIALCRRAMWTERANAVPCQWALHRRPRPLSVLALVALNTSLHIILVTVQSRLSWDEGTHGYLEPAPGLLSKELSKCELLSGSLRFCHLKCGIFPFCSSSPSLTTFLSHLLSQFSAVILKLMVSTQVQF